MIGGDRHLWVWGERSRDRTERLRSLDLPPLVVPVLNGHRRLRGPYTIGGALLRALVPVALERSPDLVAAHDIEIRAVAPDLRAVVPARHESVAARLPENERILVPAPRRTLWLANGIAEFVRACLTEPAALAVDNVHEADPTDRELLGVLARRVGNLTLAIGSPEPPPDGLQVVRAAASDGPPEDYIASDGTSDDPEAYRAYLALPEEERARRHARRAAELRGEPGGAWPGEYALGAVPYHLEHSGDREAALQALWEALDHCVSEGFLHAVTELGLRGLRLAEPGSELWWKFTQRTAFAFSGLGETERAYELFEQARRVSVDPVVHAASAYGIAMLDARYRDAAHRDLKRARGWINEAIAISTLLPDPRERAFKLGFDQNGRALIELREGRIDAALDLVQSAIDLAERDLPPEAHPVHKMVLYANRAQLLARMGRKEEALRDFDRAIAFDPAYPDNYVDRGNLLFELGRTEEALADYETAMRVSPPTPELYYNRAELRLAQGDLDGAKADLDYVLELDPGFLDAYVNRASILESQGEAEAARRDVAAGLVIDPGNAHLHALLGALEAAAGRTEEARKAFDFAVSAAPGLASAWAGRAMLRYETGDAEGAVEDLTRAIELGEDAALLYNRATALLALGRTEEAVRDLQRAHALDPDDPDIDLALRRHAPRRTA
ncbi:hypothetical protein TBS_36120 [Thermobispora bispora]|uniref:Tetratricopeptide TPR_2 repeat protein n=1 Tax=Thermobispora bispora (strain ATCC 19993 / DSM 43833 / CBS 139.67 / JCM 10125 / KCTC 9307 / NBRC 14880 / R51) TaxID=469371 RepID=D6Y4S1_THEBD|nr:tetratricopeptide repeat protein [Thermobispora bispora]ADG89247.1 Tetratricopeptide TPR_2 repeat protein [Thermobispora bispora DSM 43833]MDI9580274.1 tetratricopeptide repeat protein [Thermobispora sp.]